LFHCLIQSSHICLMRLLSTGLLSATENPLLRFVLPRAWQLPLISAVLYTLVLATVSNFLDIAHRLCMVASALLVTSIMILCEPKILLRSMLHITWNLLRSFDGTRHWQRFLNLRSSLSGCKLGHWRCNSLWYSVRVGQGDRHQLYTFNPALTYSSITLEIEVDETLCISLKPGVLRLPLRAAVASRGATELMVVII